MRWIVGFCCAAVICVAGLEIVRRVATYRATVADPQSMAATDVPPVSKAPDSATRGATTSSPKPVAQKPPRPPKPPKPDPSDEFFQQGLIPEIRITLAQKEEEQLRRDLRRYVDISFTENGKASFNKVKMKLKGAAGSFRELDDRPALTLSMRKKGERYHGMDKFHLNNSVQDESYLHEWLSAQLCAAAGVPAARVTHARVWLNGRDLGFYVLKEGMDQHFLKRHFQSARGNFYDGGFCTDIDSPLEKDSGDGPDDRADLKELMAACREGDQDARWKLIAEKVDIEAFINFAAMELMLCHWDGYCQSRNNYRIYFRTENNKACFVPHGMDQMFGDVNFSVFHVPEALVAHAVLQNPAVQTRYRQRVRELLLLLAPDKLNARIDAAHARLRPVIAAMGEDRARDFDGRAQGLKNQLSERAQAIRSQFSPEPISFNPEGWVQVENWAPRPQGDAQLEFFERDGRQLLSLAPGPGNEVQASFRTKVRLARGRYRLDARVKTEGVTATPDEKGFGAGLRLSGGSRQNNLTGTHDWRAVSHEFEIAEDLQEVELVAELRSTAGSAEFDLQSLRIHRLK